MSDATISPDGEKWYRYVDVRFAPAGDEMGNRRGDGEVSVFVHTFPVLRHTPKGVWLDVHGEERFVRTDATKRFACPTREEARESFLARKKAQIRILRSRLDRATQAWEIVGNSRGVAFLVEGERWANT